MTETRRPTTPSAEELLGLYFPVLDHGFVSLVDYMGSDDEIARAARVSYGAGVRKKGETRGLIRYLLKHKHTSPLEMCELKFHCSMPIFVARQWIRHRTANVNEVSGRYSVLPMLFYTPPEDQLRAQSKSNKQGREGEILAQTKNLAYARWSNQRDRARENYEWLNDHDFAHELARIDLPLSTYTQWYWKIDLHNLMHFLSLRVDSHAQWEIQQFGKVMAGMLKRVAPIAYEAWIDYEVCGARLSRMEMDALRCLLRVGIDTQTFITQRREGQRVSESALQVNAGGMGKREIEEFFALFSEPGNVVVPNFELDLSQAKTAEFFEAEALAASTSKDKK